MNREFIQQLERADVEGWASHQAAAPRAVVEHFGFELERPRKATLMIATRTDILGLNRALGVGVFDELTPETLDEAIGVYRSRGVAKAIFQLCPEIVSPAMEAEIAKRGFAFKTRHTKLWRRPDATITAPTDLRIERIDRSLATVYGTTAAEAYGIPPILAGAHAAAVGTPGWTHYLAYDGSRPVAVAGLFVLDGVAWCGWAATMQSHRGRGAHCALLAARIRDSAALGCELVVCETAEETSQAPNPSYRNMRRMGCEVAYYRPNYVWSATWAPVKDKTIS